MANKKATKKNQLKVFGTAPISARGQVVIPAALRKAHNLEVGDTLIFTGNPDANYFVILNPKAFKGFTDDLNKLVFNNNSEKTPEETKPKKKAK